MFQDKMVKVYNTVSSEVLLIIGWSLIASAMAIRVLGGREAPVINVLFIVAGIVIYYLPVKCCERETGLKLRRKLLWIMILAGILVFGSETVRYFTGGG